MNLADIDRICISHDDAKTGAENMAIDLALLNQVRGGEISGAFRTYTWQPWAVSLGRNQSESVVDSHRLLELGFDVVQRPTGGRAVFHAEELTYCIAARGNPRIIYQRVHEILRRAIEILLSHHLELEQDGNRLRKHYSAGSDMGQACFAASAKHEIMFDTRKIVGSAQRVIDGVVLQHGSILCGNAHVMLSDLLVMPDEKREQFRSTLQRSSISLTEAAGREITPPDVLRTLMDLEPELSVLLAEIPS